MFLFGLIMFVCLGRREGGGGGGGGGWGREGRERGWGWGWRWGRRGVEREEFGEVRGDSELLSYYCCRGGGGEGEEVGVVGEGERKRERERERFWERGWCFAEWQLPDMVSYITKVKGGGRERGGGGGGEKGGRD